MGAQDLPEVGAGPLAVCSLPFILLSRSSLGALLANVALFRVLRGFLDGFGGFVWVCLAWVLCVDCGAFYVRVRLGGLKACGVFRLSFSSLVLLSCFRPALLLGFLPCLLPCSLSCFLGFVAWLCGLAFGVGFLSLSDYTQKERAPFSRVLSCLVVGCSCFLSPFGYSATLGIMKLL